MYAALGLLLLVWAVSASGLLVRVDHLLFDVGQRLDWRAAPDDVLIVAIDQDSLDRLGRWPWSRDVHSRLLATVCAGRPKAIGFDIAFSEPGEDAAADAMLGAAVAACGNVVLPLVIENPRMGGQVLESGPIPPLARAAAALGRVGVNLDEDGIARSVDTWEGVGRPAWPLMARELLRLAGQLPADAPPPPVDGAGEAGDLLARDGNRRLNFIGPAGSVARISFAQVLNGKMPPETFAGKIVLVGATAVGLSDFFPTPVSAQGHPMPGVEVQANLLLAMRDGRLIRILPLPATLALGALLALVPLLWLPRLMPLPGLLASVAWVFLLGGACIFLPVLARLWFPPTGALIAGLSAFPLWSWRRLEAARRHLDSELMRLQAILPASLLNGVPNGASTGTAGTAPAGVRRMGFEQRIAWVQEAQRTMRDLEVRRNEALAFISHDLRAPLAGAVLELESSPDSHCAHCSHSAQSERLLQSLRRAHNMAQSFVSLARAEMLEARQMRDLDLGAVLHQAADELYPFARKLGVTVVRQLPDDPVWVVGDFDLLERMAINLLQNALTHSPPGAPVTFGLDLQAEEARFWVHNRGACLRREQIAGLFQRFSRGNEEKAEERAENANRAGSTGLGLYFVRIVAERHGGSVGVDCAGAAPGEGMGVRFWVRLKRSAG
ncbi:MAG: CHASE2 domain-containing protein [Betaproteobacteria bacterium]|nr:CHASE2 domain-containing protein [Betaproteobacteria bacterium]